MVQGGKDQEVLIRQLVFILKNSNIPERTVYRIMNKLSEILSLRLEENLEPEILKTLFDDYGSLIDI